MSLNGQQHDGADLRGRPRTAPREPLSNERQRARVRRPSEDYRVIARPGSDRLVWGGFGSGRGSPWVTRLPRPSPVKQLPFRSFCRQAQKNCAERRLRGEDAREGNHLAGRRAGGVSVVARGCGGAGHAAAGRPLRRLLLDKTITQGTRIAVAPDGRVFLAERDGRLKIWKPDTKTTVLAGQIPTGQPGELGFMGLALSPDFATTGYVYAHYVPLDAVVQHDADLARLALHDDRRHAGPDLREGDLQHPAPELRGRRPQRRRPRVRAQRRPVHLDGRQHGLLRLVRLPADGRAPGPDRQRRADDRRRTRTTRWARSCASIRSRRPGATVGVGQHVLDPRRATCSTRRWTRPTRRCPRSTRWACATRSRSARRSPTARSGSPTTAPTRRSPTRPAARPGT